MSGKYDLLNSIKNSRDFGVASHMEAGNKAFINGINSHTTAQVVEKAPAVVLQSAAAGLHTRSSLRLFEYIEMRRTADSSAYSFSMLLADAVSLMGTEKDLKSPTDFVRRIAVPAAALITATQGISVEVETIAESRRIVELRFMVHAKDVPTLLPASAESERI